MVDHAETAAVGFVTRARVAMDQYRVEKAGLRSGNKSSVSMGRFTVAGWRAIRSESAIIPMRNRTYSATLEIWGCGTCTPSIFVCAGMRYC